MLSLPFILGGRFRSQRRRFAFLVGALLAAGCGDGLINPSTLGPILVCPMPQTVESADGSPVAVVYEPPQVIAGEPPLRISCSPLSGAFFSLGESTVSCTVRDSVARTDACTFTITVARPPSLSATKFLAFGNSITGGEIAYSYPATLRAMLAARYAAQAALIQVVNSGEGGERAARLSEPLALAGEDRLPGELTRWQPQVLLLKEGVNDISGGRSSRVPIVIDALRKMVREAKRRGVVVLLATLMPARTGGTPPRGDGAQPLIPQLNERIRMLAASEGATLVDLYDAVGGSPDPYIDVDGLHPTELGYQKMAEVFFDVIRATLEVQTVAPSFQFVRHLPAAELP
jgi:lysophospholipase L1-like esterase